MATVASVAKAALQEILVQGAESPLLSSEYDDFMFAMNNYMAMLDAEGVALGYTLVSGLADKVTIPPGALYGLVYNMAVIMAPQFGMPVPPELQAKAIKGENVMRMLGQPTMATAYPSTLPLGSGNYDESLGIAKFYYPDQEADILGETTGSVGLESGT